MADPAVLAIIPARGGSKGIPRKNLVPLLGLPLVTWSIEAALGSRSISRVIVSTDDEEIAATAQAAGAEVPFLRPAELAQDDTRDFPVFEHALAWLAEHEGYEPEVVVHLRPTTPLRPAGLIDEGVRLLVERADADSVRSVCVPNNNPFKMWRVVDGLLEPLIPLDRPEPYNSPRQELPEVFWHTGTLDVIRATTITRLGSISGTRIVPLFVDAALAVDIDDEASLRHAASAAVALGLREPNGS